MARPLVNTNIPAFNLAISTLLRNPSLLMPNLTIPTFLQLPEHLDAHLHPPSSTSGLSSSSNSSTRSSPASRPNRRKIRALVLDKDNTLTPPEAVDFPKPYFDKLQALRTDRSSPFNLHDNPHGVLLVSNTAGSDPRYSRYEAEARYLESRLYALRVPVFRAPRAGWKHEHERGKRSPEQAKGTRDDHGRGHILKKPFSHAAILSYFKERGVVSSPDEIAVVGDRLSTDVLMASLMGAWSVWVRDGVTVSLQEAETPQEGMDYRGVLAKGEAALERYLRRRGVKPSVPEGWEVD